MSIRSDRFRLLFAGCRQQVWKLMWTDVHLNFSIFRIGDSLTFETQYTLGFQDLDRIAKTIEPALCLDMDFSSYQE